MLIWVLLAALLVALAVVLLIMSRQESAQPETARRFNEVLETPHDESWLNQRKWRQARKLTRRFRRLLEKTPGSDMEEVESLLRQAAFVEDKSRSIIYGSLWMTPAIGILIGLLVAGSTTVPPSVGGMFGLGIGYILPRRMLRWVAKRRQARVKEEMPVVLNLMSLLLDAGLSVEHTLKAISEQGRRITPELAKEFGWVLSRIQQGQERGEAMEEMAKRVDVAELSETIAVLKQSARYGGSLRDSLHRYLKLMEDRRMTDLREKIGKLSGQMSIVMMVFLFPALLVFLVGPAGMALVKALKTFN